MAIFLCVALAFLLLILVIPYLMPLGKDHTGIPLDALVRDNGRFLDVGGVWMYVEEQTTESAAENRAIWAEILHMRARAAQLCPAGYRRDYSRPRNGKSHCGHVYILMSAFSLSSSMKRSIASCCFSCDSNSTICDCACSNGGNTASGYCRRKDSLYSS